MIVHQTEKFKKWIRKLKDNFVKAVILRRLERIKLNDFGDSKYLGEDIFELRIMIGAGYRIYLKKCSSDIVLLLVGGDKSTQEKDISLAKKMAKEISSNESN